MEAGMLLLISVIAFGAIFYFFHPVFDSCSDLRKVEAESDNAISRLEASRDKGIKLVQEYDSMPTGNYSLHVQRENFWRDFVIPAKEEFDKINQECQYNISRIRGEGEIAVKKEKINAAFVGASLAYSVYQDSKENKGE